MFANISPQVLFLGGGIDSYNLIVPHSGCTDANGAAKDLNAEYETVRTNVKVCRLHSTTHLFPILMSHLDVLCSWSTLFLIYWPRRVSRSRDSSRLHSTPIVPPYHPTVQVPKADLLTIDVPSGRQPCTTFGIHPAMPTLRDLYAEGNASFVANVRLLENVCLTVYLKRPHIYLARGLPCPSYNANYRLMLSQVGTLIEPLDKHQFYSKSRAWPPGIFAHNRGQKVPTAYMRQPQSWATRPHPDLRGRT